MSIFDIIKKVKEENNLKIKEENEEDDNTEDFIPFITNNSIGLNPDEDVFDNVRIPPWVPKSIRPNGRIYPSSNPICRLHEEIIDFVKYISLTEEEIKIRNNIIDIIDVLSKRLWPHSKLFVFGSFKNNTSLPDSDIDIMISNVPISKDKTKHMVDLKNISFLYNQMREFNLINY